MQRTAIALMLLLTGVFLPAAAFHAQPPQVKQRPLDPAVKKDGWWIRLNTASKADRLTWTFAEPDAKSKKPATLRWHRSSDPDNFDLPESVRLLETLRFDVTAEPAGAAASFCLFYANQGVLLVEFSGSEKKVVDSRSRAKGCSP